MLPKKHAGSCLGLLNKYAGFMAVESIQENGDTQTIVIKEAGTLGWLSERAPRRVLIHSEDVTREAAQTRQPVFHRASGSSFEDGAYHCMLRIVL